MKSNRRDFLKSAGVLSTGVSLGLPGIADSYAAPARKGPKEHMIVIGHADIWEFNARFSNNRKGTQNSPLRDFIMNRYMDGGINVVITPAGGFQLSKGWEAMKYLREV
jgi:membrane dipeptidase